MRFRIFPSILMIFIFCFPAAEQGEPQAEIDSLKAMIEELRTNLDAAQKQHERQMVELQNQIRELSDELAEQRRLQKAELETEPMYDEFYEVSPGSCGIDSGLSLK